jgi:hypothetical protein
MFSILILFDSNLNSLKFLTISPLFSFVSLPHITFLLTTFSATTVLLFKNADEYLTFLFTLSFLIHFSEIKERNRKTQEEKKKAKAKAAAAAPAKAGKKK